MYPVLLLPFEILHLNEDDACLQNNNERSLQTGMIKNREFFNCIFLSLEEEMNP